MGFVRYNDSIIDAKVDVRGALSSRVEIVDHFARIGSNVPRLIGIPRSRHFHTRQWISNDV